MEPLSEPLWNVSIRETVRRRPLEDNRIRGSRSRETARLPGNPRWPWPRARRVAPSRQARRLVSARVLDLDQLVRLPGGDRDLVVARVHHRDHVAVTAVEQGVLLRAGDAFVEVHVAVPRERRLAAVHGRSLDDPLGAVADEMSPARSRL